MANQLNIANGLNIFQRVQINPNPRIHTLNNVWEWRGNGDPIFRNLDTWNARHVPDSIVQSSFAETHAGRQFVNWMRQHQPNNVPILINCRGYGGKDLVRNVRLGLLRMICKGDVKKKFVEEHPDGIQLTKLDYDTPLLNFDAPGGAYPLQNIETSGKNSQRLIDDINLNAVRGQPGPGTFRCREGHCTKTGSCTSQTSVIHWGPQPGQSINLSRRFTCDANNFVYLLHCNACIEEENWTTYVGESETFNTTSTSGRTNAHRRLGSHLKNLVYQDNRNRYPIDENFPELVSGIVDGNPDPHQLLRDPYIHFNYLHTPEDRRITILETGFPSQRDRRRAEYLYQIECGNFQYNPVTFTGSLNK